LLVGARTRNVYALSGAGLARLACCRRTSTLRVYKANDGIAIGINAKISRGSNRNEGMLAGIVSARVGCAWVTVVAEGSWFWRILTSLRFVTSIEGTIVSIVASYCKILTLSDSTIYQARVGCARVLVITIDDRRNTQSSGLATRRRITRIASTENWCRNTSVGDSGSDTVVSSCAKVSIVTHNRNNITDSSGSIAFLRVAWVSVVAMDI